MESKLMYIIFWEKNEIGRIYQNELGQYKYLPNYIELKKSDTAPMAILGNAQLTWGEMPSFFDERISKDHECKNGCKCVTDKLIIKKLIP